jgi:SAM-dependent methyltransferase
LALEVCLSNHLDLGCGKFPRNPYNQKNLHGIDVRDIKPNSFDEGFFYKKANLFLEPIPYPDNYFDSVSAFDFLEHIPRVHIDGNGNVHFLFVRLMSDIYRVLKPEGRFFALTPCYPNQEVFQDPTHVNVITKNTHHYFCGKNPEGCMYGFTGRFECIRSQAVYSSYANKELSNSFGEKFKWLRKFLKGQLSHVAWELIAKK